jgi:hypothetical protein
MTGTTRRAVELPTEKGNGDQPPAGAPESPGRRSHAIARPKSSTQTCWVSTVRSPVLPAAVLVKVDRLVAVVVLGGDLVDPRGFAVRQGR